MSLTTVLELQLPPMQLHWMYNVRPVGFMFYVFNIATILERDCSQYCVHKSFYKGVITTGKYNGFMGVGLLVVPQMEFK